MEETTLFKAMDLFETISYRNRLDSREVGLFYALLHLWNRASRPATFGGWFNQVSPLSGLSSEKTVQSARDKLVKKGIIYYYKEGNRGEPIYSFNALFSLENPLLVNIASKTPSKRQVSGELMASKRQVSGDSPQVKDKGKVNNPLKSPKGEIPSEQDFIAYCLETIPTIHPQWELKQIELCAIGNYRTYIEQGWKDGKNKPIKNWKTTIRNKFKYEIHYNYGKSNNSSGKPRPRLDGSFNQGGSDRPRADRELPEEIKDLF